MTNEQRLTDLEVHYMKLERMFEELSAVVADQQKTLDRLGAQVTAHNARLHDLPEDAASDDKPPHY